ncbi:MBL fold metallo-hydrolase [Thermophagus sp. OGC60D27]|uniref:MBL fold metallo-hydrolase n=1 Tax=Thermophagus sp. OGC60D27 TaxID=3458415 RepID=UPI004037B79F
MRSLRILFATLTIASIISSEMFSQTPRSDTFQTSVGPLEIHHVGHASLYFVFNGKTIHVDPFGRMGDYSSLPKADLILVTHAHGDHLDPQTIKTISKQETKIILNKDSYKTLQKGQILENGDETEVLGLSIKAVPAYNIIHKREDGEPFHPKGRDNGYVILFADTKVYIAGDTENIPEMAKLKEIDIAFLPMNLPYTMTPEMCKEAALMVKPKILFPYHYKMGESDPEKFARLMEGISGIEVRFRQD